MLGGFLVVPQNFPSYCFDRLCVYMWPWGEGRWEKVVPHLDNRRRWRLLNANIFMNRGIVDV